MGFLTSLKVKNYDLFTAGSRNMLEIKGFWFTTMTVRNPNLLMATGLYTKNGCCFKIISKLPNVFYVPRIKNKNVPACVSSYQDFTQIQLYVFMCMNSTTAQVLDFGSQVLFR